MNVIVVLKFIVCFYVFEFVVIIYGGGVIVGWCFVDFMIMICGVGILRWYKGVISFFSCIIWVWVRKGIKCIEI